MRPPGGGRYFHYVYREGMVDSQYDLSTAVGLFQNVVSLVLVLGCGTGLPGKANPITRLFRPQEPSGTGAATGSRSKAAQRQAVAMGGRMP